MSSKGATELKKILLVVGILFVLLLVFFALRWQRSLMLKKVGDNTQKNAEKTVSETVLPQTKEPSYLIGLSPNPVQSGDVVNAEVIFDAAGKEVVGSDVIIKYDPTLLQIEEEIVPGKFFSSYLRKTVDNSLGILKVTGINPAGDGQKPGSPVVFFSVIFKTIKPGASVIKFDFKKGKTNTTTLVEKGTSRNILGLVSDANLIIK